jgi:AAA15 family ATPase/GTPase
MASATNTQVFVTTHSQECVDAALEAFADDATALKLYRMRRLNAEPSRVEVVPYEPDEIAGALQMGLDIR